MPILKMVADIEPIQDLHGYENPWPAGGGKNKCDYDTIYSAFKVADNSFSGSSYDIAQLAISIPSSLVGQQLTWSAYIDLTGVTTPTSYTAKATVDGVQILGNAVRYGESGYTEVTFTPISTNDTVQFTWGSGIGTIAVKDFQLEIGSSRTTWSPYSNICPISGWTGANAEQRNVNLLPSAVPSNMITAQVNNTGAIAIAGNARVVAVPVPKNTTIYVTKKSGDTSSGALALGDTGSIAVGTKCYDYKGFTNASSQTLNTGNHGWLYISAGTETLMNEFWTTRELQILLTTSTDYVAPSQKNKTIPISWQTEAGTVYGGTVTVNEDQTVVMSSRRVKKIFDGTENIAYSRTSATQGYAMYVIGAKNADVVASGISNMLKPVTSGIAWTDWSQHVQNSSAYNRDQIAFRFDSSFGGESVAQTITNYKAEMARLYATGTPLEVVYELATPITYHLDSIEQITTLEGINNIWFDTGETEVTYIAKTAKERFRALPYTPVNLKLFNELYIENKNLGR